jgi:hypothetical protein
VKKPDADELWLEFLSQGPSQACGLCGNSGIVDTRGLVRTAAGYECGVRAFCICPNGRAMKDAGADIARWPSGRVDVLKGQP